MQPQILLDWRVFLILTVGGLATIWAMYKTRTAPPPPTNDCAQRIEALEQVVVKQSNAIETLQTLLYEKQASIVALEEKLRSLEMAVKKETKDRQAQAADGQPEAEPIYLLVAVGRDPMFQRDLVAIRKVKAKTGMRWTRLFPVTKRKLVEKMSRDNLNRKPIKYIHFALHSDENGLEFDDGIASPQWISENIQGARLIMVAGCKSDTVGDYLSVAEAVVTLLEDVPNEVAARFTEAFWGMIGEGVSSEDAFYAAIEMVPQVAEYAEYNG